MSEAALKRYVLALAAGGLGVLGLCAATLRLPGPAWAAALGAVTFVAAFFLLGQTSFTFAWQGHRHRMVLDEVALFVGLLALPVPAVPLLVLLSGLLEQARMRRDALKATFNLAQNVLASGAAAGAFLLALRLGAPPILAALPAALLYPLVSNFLVAGIFHRLSGEGHVAIFARRFLAPGLLAGAVGVGGGVAVAALWSLHPATLLALMPFVFLTYRYGVLASVADRELEVHKRLTQVAKDLVGVSDVDEASRRVLRACGDAFPSVGRAEVLLEGQAPIVEEFAPGDPRAAPLDEPVPGLGTLRLVPRRAASGITDVEKGLVRIVAQQLAATVGQARSLQQMATIARQEKLSALGTLVAGVAHEINNPVTYMRGALELTRMDIEEGDVAHANASLARLKEGIDRVDKITHALKAVARQGNGERAPEDVRAIAEDVAEVVKLGLPRNVALELDLAPAAPRVEANAAELHQVVLNLVKNASEALAQQGGRVKLKVWAEARDVFVEVADDGPGIPPDVQRRLFEPFFTTKRQGTGLGLSVSKGIVEAHGGEMRLESAPGKGARFTLRLPAQA
ncbi:MAG: two-component system, NtrC family, sensor kinase [Thermoplasmata archaeon]|nr:two-component system, NtrC family, sensor kinase [Thermoplasmata archaeon]